MYMYIYIYIYTYIHIYIYIGLQVPGRAGVAYHAPRGPREDGGVACEGVDIASLDNYLSLRENRLYYPI